MVEGTRGEEIESLCVRIFACVTGRFVERERERERVGERARERASEIER